MEIVVKVKQGNADIPCDGYEKATFATVCDIGNFVIAALDLGEVGKG